MKYPKCFKCGSDMEIHRARRGQNAGGEFWGCSEYFYTGCRSSRPVPQHEWDWFGFVPVPVRIIDNQIEEIKASGMADRIKADLRGHHDEGFWRDGKYYDDEYRQFGPYQDYDEGMWAFEDSLEAAENIDGTTQDAPPSKTENLISGRVHKISMAEGVVRAVNLCSKDREHFIRSSIGLSDFSKELTIRFSGSTFVRTNEGGRGIIELDDRSLVLIHREKDEVNFSFRSGYRHLFTENDVSITSMSTNDFERVARYFAKHFGLNAPSVAIEYFV